MEKFSATVEFLSGQKAAIITLTDSSGEWSGSGRIDLPRGTNADLYEAGYVHASRAAATKGGTLDRYSKVSP